MNGHVSIVLLLLLLLRKERDLVDETVDSAITMKRSKAPLTNCSSCPCPMLYTFVPKHTFHTTYIFKGTGIHAPGRYQHPTTEPYLVAHHLLLAHAKVYHLYHDHYNLSHGSRRGMIGMANCGDFRYPRAASTANDDADAAERAMLFQWGWLVDPLVYGDYPAVMRQRLGNRLPVFSVTAETTESSGGYWDDIHVDFRSVPVDE